MKKIADIYTQCRLVKGTSIIYTWIPAEFAELGKVLKLKMNDGEWSDGWKVDMTYGSRPYRHVDEHERDYLKQRSVSDI